MISFGIKDVIDILLVAFLLYYIYRLMKRSSAANIFTGIIIFILVWIVVSQIFSMRLLGTILDKLVSMGALALVVLFQEEPTIITMAEAEGLQAHAAAASIRIKR